MKLLFDQNLSPHLVSRLAGTYPGSAHVSACSLAEAFDAEVWAYAQLHEYVIVSKDSDFSEMSLLRGFPPQVVWIRKGNCTTGEIEALLRRSRGLVEMLLDQREVGVLVLH